MFTWIISHQATIVAIKSGLFSLKKQSDMNLHIGQSVAHDGACMTITEVTDETYSFFAMEESLQKTNFSHKKIGDTYNIEFCVQASSMLDGHMVSGHVDTTGKILKTIVAPDGSKKLTISHDVERDKYKIPKWSITINGVSLTLVDVWLWRCTVWLIPLTQKITNLWALKVNDLVNIEFDMFGKYVLNYLEHTWIIKK
jgi:riboflavin synthase